MVTFFVLQLFFMNCSSFEGVNGSSQILPSVIGSDTNLGDTEPKDNKDNSGPRIESDIDSDQNNNEDEPVGAAGPLLAVPMAEGAGKEATGGRGGMVITVDTLSNAINANDGLTSLREAIELFKGPRIIVFSVGGIIDIGSWDVNGQHGDFTLACQTAPSPGVILRGPRFVLYGKNIISQHCVRRATDGAENGRGIGFGAGAQDIYIDHWSVTWASDEGMQAYNSGNGAAMNNISITNSIIAEGDADSAHPQSRKNPGYHAMGPACNSQSSHRTTAFSISRNLIAHNASRNGAMYSCDGEVVNNIIYNWSGQAMISVNWKGPGRHRFVNNFLKLGPSSPSASNYENNPLCGLGQGWTRCAMTIQSYPQHQMLIEGNVIQRMEDTYLTAVNLPHHPRYTYSNVQFDWQSQTILPAKEIGNPEGEFLKCVGSTSPIRDSVDLRIVNEFKNRTGATGIFDNKTNSSVNTVIQRDFSMYKSSRHPAGYDSDKDGMPDEWEIKMKFNPLKEDSSEDHDSDGYTNIEEFLADRSRCSSL